MYDSGGTLHLSSFADLETFMDLSEVFSGQEKKTFVVLSDKFGNLRKTRTTFHNWELKQLAAKKELFAVTADNSDLISLQTARDSFNMKVSDIPESSYYESSPKDKRGNLLITSGCITSLGSAKYE